MVRGRKAVPRPVTSTSLWTAPRGTMQGKETPLVGKVSQVHPRDQERAITAVKLSSHQKYRHSLSFGDPGSGSENSTSPPSMEILMFNLETSCT